MTNEQWLVYIWSIYPNGGYLVFYIILLVIWAIILCISFISFITYSNDKDYYNEKFLSGYFWITLGKWKYRVTVILLVLIFLSNLVPNRNYFAYIIATPYIVDTGKSLVDTLEDKDSKLYKLNKIMDKGLDKILIELENKKEEK